MPLRFVLDDIAESECDTIVYAATAAALSDGAAPAPGASLPRRSAGSLPKWESILRGSPTPTTCTAPM